jgi:hypothetical protein
MPEHSNTHYCILQKWAGLLHSMIPALRLNLQLGVMLMVLSISVASTANAQGLFSWFGAKKEQETPALFVENKDLQNQNSLEQVKHKEALHKAAFSELAYHYFQEDYQQVLLLIEVGFAKHGFSHLSQNDSDSLQLMQGAAQLQLGLYNSAKILFKNLLGQTTSNYVQANTWFFMAKAGFENKQSNLSEQAYSAVLEGDLREELSDSQWYELLYLTAYTRMQLNQDWQSLALQIPEERIYSAYLRANLGTIFFNQGDYELATLSFTKAKQALLKHQNSEGIVSRTASSVYDSLSWFIRPWKWFDSNAIAQEVAKERERLQSSEEQNALFDRINLSLGQSLLQQGDLPNAIAVIQNVSVANNVNSTVPNIINAQVNSAESLQALLTYGWANARENRWQTAMAAWQYLQDNSVGLISLQASYGLAYAFSRQDNLGQAFYALQSTANEIDVTISALNDFAAHIQQGDFFSHYNEQWPQALDDIKLGFFAPNKRFNAQHLLLVREQATQVITDITNKETRLTQLNTMLEEREASYQQRLQGISLRDAKARIEKAQQNINAINTLVTQADSFEKELYLSKKMATAELSEHVSRFERANASHERLVSNTNSKKRPLKASYKTRLDRINGILTWELNNNFIANQWQHKQLLKQAQLALNSARTQYQKLQEISQNNDFFNLQRGQFALLNESLNTQMNAANKVYSIASATLTQELLGLIEERKTQLNTQSANTRLAMLRIQDLQQQGGN